MVRRVRICATLLVGLVLPGVGLAQGPGTCRPQLDSARVGRHIEIAPGQFHQFGAGGVFARCLDQPTTMQADSVAWFCEQDLMEFIGSVRFQGVGVVRTIYFSVLISHTFLAAAVPFLAVITLHRALR